MPCWPPYARAFFEPGLCPVVGGAVATDPMVIAAMEEAVDPTDSARFAILWGVHFMSSCQTSKVGKKETCLSLSSTAMSEPAKTASL